MFEEEWAWREGGALLEIVLQCRVPLEFRTWWHSVEVKCDTDVYVIRIQLAFSHNNINKAMISSDYINRYKKVNNTDKSNTNSR